jgi:hypothetical protein
VIFVRPVERKQTLTLHLEPQGLVTCSGQAVADGTVEADEITVSFVENVRPIDEWESYQIWLRISPPDIALADAQLEYEKDHLRGALTIERGGIQELIDVREPPATVVP